MKYKWLLFDLDNTLLDFDDACKKSLWRSFEDIDMVCTDEIYDMYKAINAQVWKEFEEKTITAIELRRRRFKDLFELLGTPNIDGYDFNAKYLDHLVNYSCAYEGIHALLARLQTSYRMTVITNGLREVQRPRLEKTGLAQYFDSIVVSDEIGSAKPDVMFFYHAYDDNPHSFDKRDILVIGDGLHTDIRGGNAFGVDTCWINSSGGTNDIVIPTYTIDHVTRLEEVLV